MSRIASEENSWIEISVEVPCEYADPVAHLLSEHGDGRVFVRQLGDWDLDDPENSSEMDVVSVFGYLVLDDSAQQRKTMIEVGLKLIGSLVPILPHRERIINASEWENQSFPTVRISDRIAIAPGYEDDGQRINVADEGITILLSPGLAFGTGHHPTTRMCLLQLEQEFANRTVEALKVLDVGCGSGILSIAALKFGAAYATCFDIDETAVRAARQNMRMSGVDSRGCVILGSLPDVAAPPESFDFVLANITSRVITDIAENLVSCAKTDGIILVSGILSEKSDEVLETFASHDVKIDAERRDGDWMMLRLIRK